MPRDKAERQTSPLHRPLFSEISIACSAFTLTVSSCMTVYIKKTLNTDASTDVKCSPWTPRVVLTVTNYIKHVLV